jgi:hypothetical protein
MGILIKVIQINRGRGVMWESDVHDSGCETIGELFSNCRSEYGRCASKVYIDRENGEPMAIGWMFEKQDHYQDTGNPFILETWVTVHEKKPEMIHHYRDIEEGR